MMSSKGLRLVGLLSAIVLNAAACDDDPRRAAGAVAGTWVLVEPEGEETVYLRITTDSIEVYEEDEIADCFERVGYEILGVDGDRFRLRVGEDELTIRMRREEEQLVIDAFDVLQRYDATTVELGALVLCEPVNPNVDCATLPALTIDAAAGGTIAGVDEENPDGRHYDLFRFEPVAADSFHVDMESGEVDSYVVLYDSAGAWIAWNDDRSALTLDARVRATLEPGCYIVMATTAFPDEFGDYELTVTAP